MIADDVVAPRERAAAQVMGAIRSFEIAAGWTLEDMCVAYLVEANRVSPTSCRDSLQYQWRKLAGSLVDAFRIEV